MTVRSSRVSYDLLKMLASRFFGSPTYVRDDGQDVMYNSAFLVGTDTTVLGRYDKIHLVPFWGIYSAATPTIFPG